MRGPILTLGASILLLITLSFAVIADYQYENKIISQWNLAEKASTIELKSQYIDQFMVAIDKPEFRGQYNAVILKTPDNSFDANFNALQSFQGRLQEIKTMDVRSFEYQTAIQQITAQEQGEADEMLSVIHGIWLKDNYPLLWDWVCAVQVLLSIVILCIGIFLWIED
jgi:hypothetical protein